MEITLRNKNVDQKVKDLIRQKEDLLFKQVDEEKNYSNEIETIEKRIESFEAIAFRTYVAPFISGECYKELFPMVKKLQGLNSKAVELDAAEKDLNELIDYICKLFGYQFTIDDFWKGISMEKMLSEVARITNEVMRKIYKLNESDSDTQQ